MIELSYWRDIQLRLETERKLALIVGRKWLIPPGNYSEEDIKETIHLLMIGSHAGRIGDVEDTI